MILLEPHQGVVGSSRPDDPILTTEAVSSLILRLVVELHSAVLVGHPAPKVVTIAERMMNPVAGDPVVVFDAIGRDFKSVHRGVGYLITVREEWATSLEEWQAEMSEDPDLGTDERAREHRAWYVQYGPNPVDICRWTNCTVLAAPQIAGVS